MSSFRCSKFRYEIHPSITVGIVHLERKRPWPSCINPETGNQWSLDMKNRLINVVNKVKFNKVVRIDEMVKADDDPSLRTAVDLSKSENVDVMVVIQPTISDGRLVSVLAQQWEHCIVLWATPEEQAGEMISGNSLVGTHLMTATLRQLGFQAQLVYGNLDWCLAEEQLLKGVNVAFAARYLRKSKLALIGYQAPGFQDLHPDPFLMRKTFGTVMLHIGISEYVNLAKSIPEEEVVEDIEYVTNVLKLPFKDLATGFGVKKEELHHSSRHYLAMKKLASDNNLDGLAIRCWPELPGPTSDSGGLDQWCYMALARLATEGFPIACEGDVDGALGCLIGKLLGCGTIYLSDWLEHDKRSLTLWHGGMAPFQLSEAVGTPLGPCISRHFNNKKSGCLDATIKSGMDVTVFRFWVFNHQYRAIILTGKTVKPKRHILGNNGLVEFGPEVNLISSFDNWLQSGFPHHVCVVEGHQESRLKALALQFNVQILPN